MCGVGCDFILIFLYAEPLKPGKRAQKPPQICNLMQVNAANLICTNHAITTGLKGELGRGGTSDAARWRSREMKLDIREQGLTITIFAISFPTIGSHTRTPPR